MAIKRYSDFDHSNTKTIKDDSSYSDFDHSNTKTTAEIFVTENPIENIVKEEPIENIKEEVLLTPKDSSNLNIEILEEKIIKFNAGNIKDILETIKTKYSDTDYYIRKKDNELHIVKYNEALKMNINEFVNTLLKFYSTKMPKITEGIKVKGNNNFSIIENLRPQYSDKFIEDLTKLLSKKNND